MRPLSRRKAANRVTFTMAKKQQKRASVKGASKPLHGPTWPVQEARAQLSAVIDAALKGKPQRITRNGKDTVVVVREADFAKSKGEPTSIREWLDELQDSPLGELMEEGLINFEGMRKGTTLREPFDLSDVDVEDEK